MTQTPLNPQNRNERQWAYAYSRVSTQQQAEKGELKDQQHRLRQFARENRFDLRGMEEDIGSAHRKDALAALPGLQAVLSQARDEGGFILVTDISRLSRNLQEWRTRILPFGVDVFSEKEGQFLSPSEQEDLVRKAEAEAKRIGRDTKKALAGKDRTKPDSAEMRRRGSVANIERQMRIEDDVLVAVQILRERYGKITARELGEELLRRGRKPPRGNSFKLHTARERLREALKQMELEDEVNAAPAGTFETPDGSLQKGPAQERRRRVPGGRQRTTLRKTPKARQRRSWRFCGGVRLVGIPRPPPEPKERPPPACSAKTPGATQFPPTSLQPGAMMKSSEETLDKSGS